MYRIPDFRSDGFTLIETVVATGVVVTALAGLAQLFAVGVRFAQDADIQGVALTAAQDKIEILRSLAFTYGPAGEAVTGAGLAPSPGASLDEDAPGFADFLDADGAVVDEAAAHRAAYTRRWRVKRIDPFAPEAIAVEVCVFRSPAAGRTARLADACLATVRGRQP